MPFQNLVWATAYNFSSDSSRRGTIPPLGSGVVHERGRCRNEFVHPHRRREYSTAARTELGTRRYSRSYARSKSGVCLILSDGSRNCRGHSL